MYAVYTFLVFYITQASTMAELAGSHERTKQVTMAILPLGTSNDFAATTGIPQVQD
jgi:diacylglycerol kinase family enzyme